MVAAVATSFKVSLVFFSADFNAYKICYTHLYKSHCIHNNFRVIMCYIYHTKYHIISQSLKKISHYSCEVLVADLSWSINCFLLFFCSCFFLIKIPVKKWLIFRHSVLISLSNFIKDITGMLHILLHVHTISSKPRDRSTVEKLVVCIYFPPKPETNNVFNLTYFLEFP